MTRLMALDVGEARIGVAVGSTDSSLAFPYTTLHLRRDEAQLWDSLARLIEETGAEEVVVGLPISLDGRIHAQGERIQAFGERLKRSVSIPLVFWDERYSTAEAQRLLMEQGASGGRGAAGGDGGRHQGRKRGRNKKQEIDALAAAVILQDYLDHLGSKTEENRS